MYDPKCTIQVIYPLFTNWRWEGSQFSDSCSLSHKKNVTLAPTSCPPPPPQYTHATSWAPGGEKEVETHTAAVGRRHPGGIWVPVSAHIEGQLLSIHACKWAPNFPFLLEQMYYWADAFVTCTQSVNSISFGNSWVLGGIWSPTEGMQNTSKTACPWAQRTHVRTFIGVTQWIERLWVEVFFLLHRSIVSTTLKIIPVEV